MAGATHIWQPDVLQLPLCRGVDAPSAEQRRWQLLCAAMMLMFGTDSPAHFTVPKPTGNGNPKVCPDGGRG